MPRRSISAWLILAAGLIAGAVRAEDAIPPRRVEVLPVFFVPEDGRPPTENQTKRLARHIEWCQTRYRELLDDQATFARAEKDPFVYRSSLPLRFYRDQPENSAPRIVSELLAELHFNRFNCPYILLVVMMNHEDDFPAGGGRPLNGGLNTGGGIVILSSFALDRSANFQSTFQHELGHAFGLPHVDVYGYDMKSNDSIMSYNPMHHTRGFKPGRTSGRLIPEDIRALSINQRVFPGLHFDPEKDIPRGYSIAARMAPLGPMRIPGQPDGVKCTTSSGEEYGSKVANIVQGYIAPNKKVGSVTFDAATMWHSAKAQAGWVSVDVAFPFEIELSGVGVHSQHSGEYHAAQAMRVWVRDADGRLRAVAEKDLRSADEVVALPSTKGLNWRFQFRAGESGQIVLRGLRFFSGVDELFPPLVPHQ